MSDHTRATSAEKISRWIRDAAVAQSWRAGHHLRLSPPLSIESSDVHHPRIQAALQRARRKTFVAMAKPFRRFFRNQGAVNDSLIEAVHHLSLQNEQVIEEIAALRESMSELRAQLRFRASPPDAAEKDDACE
ncbi:MAG: hypothetical protein ABIR71_12105 [Chthoniobacterales bacterium]